MQYLDAISKTTEWSLFPNMQYHSNPGLCSSQQCWRSYNWMVLWRLARTSKTHIKKKDVLFKIGDWNAKVGSQGILGIIGKFGLGVQNKAGQRLTEMCQENTLVPANTLFRKHKRKLYTWTSPYGQYQNQIDYILCSQRWSAQSKSTRPWADYGSDHEFLIAKFTLKLKKIGKTTKSNPLRLYSGSDK